MKRQFLGRLLSLFLVGTVVAGVGCKDYDDDITSLNNRIDELTTGQIASVEKQMQSLQNAVDRLDGVDSGLKDEIEALQGKAETQAGEIGKLQEELGKAASASEVEALKKQIETLESDKGKLEKRIEALESARTSLQDEIDAVKGSPANDLTKSDRRGDLRHQNDGRESVAAAQPDQGQLRFGRRAGFDARRLRDRRRTGRLSDADRLTGGDPPERDGDEELAGRSDGADPGEI